MYVLSQLQPYRSDGDSCIGGGQNIPLKVHTELILINVAYIMSQVSISVVYTEINMDLH